MKKQSSLISVLILLFLLTLSVGGSGKAVATSAFAHPLLSFGIGQQFRAIHRVLGEERARGATPRTPRESLRSSSFGAGNDVGATAADVHVVIAGDLDNDGDADLVSGDANGTIIAWQNDGTPFTGLWPSQTVSNTAASIYTLALADLDHDGDLDLASGCGGAAAFEIMVWENDGTPFAGEWTSNGVGGAADVLALAVGDLDHDGQPDLVSGDSGAVIYAWQNDGTPFTGLWTSQMVGNTTDPTYALALGDLDNDGYLDLVSGDARNQVNVWENDGTPFSGTWTANLVGSSKDTVNALALADLDGDGALDIVSDVEYPSATDYGVAVWQNDGTPFSGLWTWSVIGDSKDAVNALAVGDLDNDGRVDVASGSGSGEDYEVIAWYSPASPFVDPWTQEDVGASADDVNGVALADLDHDGDLDIASASGNGEDFELIVWENTHTPEPLGAWTEVTQPAPTYDALSVSVADLDHDGKLDIAAGTDGKGVYVWRGDGGYTWTQVGATDLPDSGIWTGIAWGQINNVGDLDLAAANQGGGLKAWRSQENGTNWDDISTGLPTSGQYQAVALGHIDHDGLLDLAACGTGLGVRTWQGTGSSWNVKNVLSDTLNFCDVALAHVDHDGNLDIVAANCEGKGIPVWLGDGGFGANLATFPATSGSYNAVALGDVNNDGYTDIIAAPDSGGVQLWTGDGGTTWNDKGVISPTLTALSLDLGDFDNDGNLDILAGLKGGVRVWRGDGAGSWTDASTNLPTTGYYYDVAFGRVDGDAALDIVGAESGASGVHVWTATEPPPGGWTDFQPATNPPYSWVRSQQITCTVQVADAGSGLDVSTAEYRFSRDGGASWVGGWLSATVSGSDGTTDPQVMTATNVLFNQDSETQNAIQFRIRDMAGLTGTSPVYIVAIDATPPTNPATVESTSHTSGVWSDSYTVVVTWTDGIDATSGPRYYSYDLTTSSTSLPDETPDTSGNTGTAYATADGQNWYFHLRTQDYAGNWATDAVHIGPFWIDRTNPSNPSTLWSTSHTTAVWSNDPTVDVQWTAGDDGDGSGIAGYWYSWSHGPQDDPTTYNTTGTSATSGSLSTDDDWYFNLRTRDNVGRRAADTLHLGPFYIDRVDPYAWLVSPGHEVNTSTFTVAWTGGDADSGLANFDVQTSDNGTTWDDWQMGTSATAASFTGERGETYYFRVRARDNAGNVSDWSAAYDVTVGVDVTVRVEDEDGTPLSGAKVYRNGREVATTPGSGTVTLHHTLLNDELAAKYLIEEHSAHKGHHSGWAYRTYITSVDFDADGDPQLHTVTNTYVTQVLTVRRDNPLVGFHILVSVEWDADSTFLSEVLSGFQSASAYLFDLTDGQMLWEYIEIVDDKRNWADCDYRIHASNTEWPRAHVDGMRHGSSKHVYLGRYFNGNSSNQGPWNLSNAYRTTVHEFGHYGLGLYDEYLDSDGAKDGGCTTDRSTTPVDVQACFMDYQYTATEMCSALPTHPHNTDTYQHERHGETCWDTVYYKYRDLAGRWLLERPDQRGSIMPGPTSIPVDDWMYYSLDNWYTGVCPPFVTSWVYPDGSPAAGFQVWVENGRTIRQGETDSDGRITILGAHDGDTIRVRGGSCGWFCVYSGSTTAHCSGAVAQAEPGVSVASEPFGFDLGLVPRDSGGLIEVSAQASVALTSTPQVLVWQDGLTLPITVALTYDSATDSYTGTVTLSTSLGLRGQLWGQATDTEGHTVTVLEPFNVQQVTAADYAWLRSDDGNFEVFLKPNSLVSDTMVSIVPSDRVSLTQGSLVMVGSAYEVNVSSGEYALSQTAAVNMRYHAEMVANVVTSTMQIYHWDAQARQWVSDGGTVDPDHGLVSTRVDHLSTFAILGEKVVNKVYLPLILKDHTP